MFRGLNVFPLTPLHRGELDEGAFTRILGRLQHPAVQAITLFGSTGAGPYLTRAQRLQALALARDLTGEAAGSRFAPLFDLFTRFGGSIRVAAAIATLTGLTRPLSLPEPLRDLEPEEMTVVQETLTRLGLL